MCLGPPQTADPTVENYRSAGRMVHDVQWERSWGLGTLSGIQKNIAVVLKTRGEWPGYVGDPANAMASRETLSTGQKGSPVQHDLS